MLGPILVLEARLGLNGPNPLAYINVSPKIELDEDTNNEFKMHQILSPPKIAIAKRAIEVLTTFYLFL